MKEPKLRRLEPTVRKLDIRIAVPPPKEADAYYSSSQHRAWRDDVIRSARGQCEWMESGQRCSRAEPEFRMYADHVVEIKDGGDRLGRGRCLCGSHHTLKTNIERAKRNRKM